jgi:hypothetical protein
MAQNYVLLERIELNASAASVTFANIPQSGYTDLKIVASARATNTNVHYNQHLLTINGSTSGFSGKRLWGDGSSPASYSTTRNSGLFNSNSSTANIFGSTELYFTNYLSSNNKSFSIETAEENNASASYVEMIAGLWSNTAAINSITLTPEISGDYMQYSTFSLYGLAAVGTTPAIAPKASGGNITTDGTYFIHTFLTTQAFTPFTNLTCDYLVVGGGAGGGNHAAGGGGAGGLRSTVTATGGGGSLESALSVTATPYTIQVGAGGAGLASQGASNSNYGQEGTASIFSSITAAAGGGGGAIQNLTGRNGGSGGGGGSTSVNSGGTGTANQGYAGGTSSSTQGGGGGGAGAVGSTPNGGNGVAVAITGSSVTYAGGGGGSGSSSAGTGGSGGGGNGATNNTTSNTAGTINTGSGGGAQWYSPSGAGPYGAGGSGIVIIRYTIA